MTFNFMLVIFFVLLWVVPYSKHINSKLLIIKSLYDCYSDMFTINGFIQFSILLVYSLMMVTVKCSRSICTFLKNNDWSY